MTSGSSLWQTLFLSFALILILFEMARGWRLGVVRQGVRLIALITAYGAAIFGGRLLLPVLRPLLHAPDLFISIGSGALLAFLLYALINAIGSVLFKRTGEQSIGAVRLLYGICGAFLGIFFGTVSVWLVVVAIRSLGAIAGTEMHQETAAVPHPPVARGSLPVTTQSPPATPPAVVASLAKLKNSIELGPLGEALKAVDVVPAQTYQTLGKVGSMVSNGKSAERFLSFPGAKALTENPKIVALRDDPEIIDLIEQQRYLDLLQNPKLIEAMNDPVLAAELRSFDFQKALEYALREN